MLKRSGALCGLISVSAVLLAQELPKDDSEDAAFEVEPPVLIPNRSNDVLPGDANAKRAPNLEPDRLEKALERAKKNSAGAERLFKMGVLARVEVEQRALRVIVLESELENSRCERAKEAMVEQEQRLAAGEISKAELSKTEAALTRAVETARIATAKRERAELEAAEVNLRRQQKLLAAGIGRKSEVARAERKLAELKAAKQ